MDEFSRFTIYIFAIICHFFPQNYAQTLVDADRTSLFLVDNKTNELYARIFDIGGSLEDSRSSKLQKEIRYYFYALFVSIYVDNWLMQKGKMESHKERTTQVIKTFAPFSRRT